MNLVTLPWAEFREVRRRTTWVPTQAKHSGKQVWPVWEDFSTSRILCKQNISTLKWSLIDRDIWCILLILTRNGRHDAAVKNIYIYIFEIGKITGPEKVGFSMISEAVIVFYCRALHGNAAPICARRPVGAHGDSSVPLRLRHQWNVRDVRRRAGVISGRSVLLSRLTAAQRRSASVIWGSEGSLGSTTDADALVQTARRCVRPRPLGVVGRFGASLKWL